MRLRRVVLLLAVLLVGCTETRLPPSATSLPTPPPDTAPPAATSLPTLPAAPPPLAPVRPAVPSPDPLPSRPPRLEDQAEAVASFLNASPGNHDRLAELLAAWDAAGSRPSQPSTAVEGDVDGDGEPELALFLMSGASNEQLPGGSRGSLTVLKRARGRYSVLQVPDGLSDASSAGPVLLQIGDLTRDGKAEIAFDAWTCGASTCVHRPRIAGWDGRGGLKLLSPPGLEMAYPEIQIIDTDADGLYELVLEGGVAGSAGAGPQRKRIEVYGWRGRGWELVRTSFAPSRERYFVIVDANAAFARKDYSTALRLYRQAARDDTLVEGEAYPPKRLAGPELRAFARFRLVVADAVVAQEDDARATLEELRHLDAATPFPRLAAVFWDGYGMTADVRAACARVTRIVEADPLPVLRAMNGWGYANRDLRPDEVCVIP